MNSNKIILYPKIEDVFSDTELGMYFKPLLTVTTSISHKIYNIHIIGSDGLVCEKNIKYSESYFFGFKYNNGTYDFLGSLEVFKEFDKVPNLYHFLEKDFMANKDSYLKNKRGVSKYLEDIKLELEKVSKFNDFSDAEYYAQAFYSFEFTKYYYEKYGKHNHISVVTENYGKNTDSVLLNDGLSILEEFFLNLEYNLENNYDINEEMYVLGIHAERFLSIIRGGTILALLDKSKDIVYILEYS